MRIIFYLRPKKIVLDRTSEALCSSALLGGARHLGGPSDQALTQTNVHINQLNTSRYFKVCIGYTIYPILDTYYRM